MARSYEAGQIFTNINGSGLTTNGAGAQYPITIYSGNAFLTPAAQAALFPAGGPASFQMNRMDNDLMSRLSLDQHTGALAVGAGLNGTLGGDRTWDFAYTHGETRTQLTTRNNVNTARFYAALDAVRDPATGNTVCNVTLTAPGAFPGCVPLNLFGQSATVVNGSNASQAALNYVSGTTWWMAHNGLDDFSANVSGTLWQGWAGPIKAAMGVEYRLASLNVTTTTPDNSFNPQYLRLAPPGTFAATAASPLGTFPPANLANFKEVQSGAQGSENISEANLEMDVPLLRDVPGIGLLTLNGGARYTEYHVAGQDPTSAKWVKAAFSASTWKVGVEWQVDDDLKLRATRSRDIRAPTLWDLFQGPVTTHLRCQRFPDRRVRLRQHQYGGQPVAEAGDRQQQHRRSGLSARMAAQPAGHGGLFPHHHRERDRRRERRQFGGAVAVPGVRRHLVLLRADPAADLLQQHLAAEFSHSVLFPGAELPVAMDGGRGLRRRLPHRSGRLGGTERRHSMPGCSGPTPHFSRPWVCRAR